MNWRKTLERILSVDVIIAGAALSVLIIVTFLGAIMRYFFNNPFVWQEEVQLALIMYTVFFGGSVAFRSGSHIAIDMVVETMPKKAQKVADIVIYIVVMAVIIYLMVNGYNYMLQLSNGRTTDVLQIPMQYIYGAVPVGCALMLINCTLHTYDTLFGKNKSDAKEEM